MSKNIDLRHLRAIRAIIQTGSLHGAAKEVGTSQPALSRLVNEAEQRLGLDIFERNSKGSRPTDAGCFVDEVARRILTDISRLEQFGRDERWSIKVGCIHRALDYVVPTLISKGTKLSPRLQFELTESDSQSLMDDLEQGKLDVAVLSPGVRVPLHIETQPLYVDRNVFVVGRPTQCELSSPVTARELARHEFVGPVPGTPSRYEFDEYWIENNVEAPVCRFSARTYDAIARSLAGTNLVAILPSATAQEYVTKGFIRMLDVERSLPLRPVHVAWNARTTSVDTRNMVSLLLQQTFV